jgi:hypothetical protein
MLNVSHSSPLEGDISPYNEDILHFLWKFKVRWHVDKSVSLISPYRDTVCEIHFNSPFESSLNLESSLFVSGFMTKFVRTYLYNAVPLPFHE